MQVLYAVEGGLCDYLCEEAESEAAEEVCSHYYDYLVCTGRYVHW